MKNPLNYPKDLLIRKLIRIHPFIYDFYYFRFKDIQQGSIPKKYKIPPWDKNKPHCVIFTNRYWFIHTAIDMAFAKERQKNGYNVTVVGCDRAVATCDNSFYEGSPSINHQCRYCAYMLEKLCERCGVKYISVKRYLKNSSISAKNELNKRDYEQIVNSSWIRLLRNINPSEKAEYDLKDQLIESCKIYDRFFRNFFQEYPVDQVIMTNGKFFAEYLLSEYCKELNIPFITYERGARANTVIFGLNKPAVPPDTGEKWDKIKNRPLSNEQKNILYKYLGERFIGNSADSKFIEEFSKDKALYENYSIDPNKKIVVLFSNIIWDSSVVGEDRLFNSLFEWVETTIRHYVIDDNVQLIIRDHPVERILSANQKTRNSLSEFIKEKCGSDLRNIILIPPESNINSYILMEMADLGLVYSSTTGIEMALKNKPVIVSGNPHYLGTEFVYSPKTKEDYLDLLSQSLAPRLDQVEYAQRYAYMYFIDHMVPYDDIIRQVGFDYQFVDDIEKSTILKRGGF